MPLSDHVSITISKNVVGITQAGFGTPMILSHNASATFGAQLIRYYTSLTGVAADFPVTTSPEYRAANAIFSQTPHPTQIAIGAAAAARKPTQVFSLTAVTPTTLLTYTYSYNVKGQGFADTTVTFTSDASPTDAEWAAGVVAALNAVAGKNYTAAGAASPVTVTGNAAGNWFSIEAVNVADTKVSQTHADPGIATDLAAIALADSGWYALYTLYNSSACVLATAAWVEANVRIYVPDVPDWNAINVALGSASDPIDIAHTNAYSRTMIMYHPSSGVMAGAAWLGRVLPIKAGAESWKWKTLAGIPAVALTSTHRTNLINKKGNSYQAISGVNITWEGSCADGEFMDTIRGLDAFTVDASTSIFTTFTGVDKVEMEDSGVARTEGALRGALTRAVQSKIFALDSVTVTVPLVANVNPNDRANRVLSGVQFTARLSGAIHDVLVTGVVTA